MTSWAEEAVADEGGVQGLRKEHGGLRLPSAAQFVVCVYVRGGFSSLPEFISDNTLRRS